MFSKSHAAFIAFSILTISEQALGLPVRRSPSSNASSAACTSCPSAVVVTVSGTNAAAATGAAGAVTVTANGAASTTATSPAAASSAAASGAAASGSANFGSCSTPQIEFGDGFDGRKETSFEPVDKTSYNHGSADNINIISQFMCDALTNTCGANQAAKSTCSQAQAAASAAQPPQSGAQADAFNAVFGNTTDFAAITPLNDQGQPASGASASAGTGASSAATTGASTAAATGSSAAAGGSAAAATSVSASTSGDSATPATSSTSSASSATSSMAGNTANDAATGENLQTFTGNLGGTTAPAVTESGNGQFQVAGNASFDNKQTAITRSCDVQHNQCADAANAAGNSGNLTVPACTTQQTQCDAASP